MTAAVIGNKVVLDAGKREAAKADAVITFVFESTKKDILGRQRFNSMRLHFVVDLIEVQYHCRWFRKLIILC